MAENSEKRKTTTKKATANSKTQTKKKTTTTKSSTKTTKTTPKRKEIEKKKEESKGLVKMFNDLKTVFLENKVISILISIIILLLIVLIIVTSVVFSNPKVITIDGNDFSKRDFMIYLYSVKYNYFGEDNTDLPEATLNTLVDKENEVTMREYLKEKTVNEIKTAGAIQTIANKYNITLSNEDLEEIKKEKNEFIKKLGGKNKFKNMLRDNNTDEEAYDKMSKSDKLFKKVYEKIYGEGKINDLTDEEKTEVKNAYYQSYKKIRQIVLATINPNTMESLDEVTLNQKETLATTILTEAKSGIDFDELIKKYSEDVTGTESTYSIYYTDGQMLDEVEKAVNKLNIGDISEVVKSKYALHIIKRDELDDGKLTSAYNKKREEKLLKEISQSLNEVPIIYHDSYTNIKIK